MGLNCCRQDLYSSRFDSYTAPLLAAGSEYQLSRGFGGKRVYGGKWRKKRYEDSVAQELAWSPVDEL